MMNKTPNKHLISYKPSHIITANNTYFLGSNTQTSHAVHVRIRAWKSSSLPEPDFSQLDVVVEAGSPDGK